MKIKKRTLLKFGLAGGAYCLAPRVFERTGQSMGFCSEGASNFPISDEDLSRRIPQSLKTPLPANRTLRNIYANKQFTLFGDTDHTNTSFDRFFWSRENIDLMAEAGVKHLCLETHRDGQQMLDDITDGKVDFNWYVDAFIEHSNLWYTREQAQELLNNYFLGLQYAKQKGLKVHATDYADEGFELSEFSVENMRLQGRYKTRMCGADAGFTDMVSLTYFITHLHRVIPAAFVSNELMASRDDDTERAQLIQEKVGDEKAVIHYGNGHFDNVETSIKTLLGPENTTHIQFHKTALEYDGDLGPDYDDIIRNTRYTPDFIYSVDKGAVFASPVNRYPELTRSRRAQMWQQNRNTRRL